MATAEINTIVGAAFHHGVLLALLMGVGLGYNGVVPRFQSAQVFPQNTVPIGDVP